MEHSKSKGQVSFRGTIKKDQSLVRVAVNSCLSLLFHDTFLLHLEVDPYKAGTRPEMRYVFPHFYIYVLKLWTDFRLQQSLLAGNVIIYFIGGN